MSLTFDANVLVYASNTAAPEALWRTPLTSDAGWPSIRCMRTTLDIDPLILEELRARAKAERKTMGELASDLLARALCDDSHEVREPFQWESKPMGLRIDPTDIEAILALDASRDE